MEKLAVILPSRGLMFSETLEDLLRELGTIGVPWQIYWSHAKPLPQCFNDPTEEALKDPSVFAVLFCEDDMIIPEGMLAEMFETKYPVTAMDYPFQQNGDATILRDPKGMAYWTGTGFMLVARQVLENLERPIWRTDTTFDPFIDKDTLHFWPRKLTKVFYGLHDLRFGILLYSAGLPIMPMERFGGQHKLVNLGKPGSNNGAHEIMELTEVGKNLVSGMISKDNSDLFLGAMNRVENIKIWEEKPPFISYDENDQPYLNDGREFERVQ